MTVITNATKTEEAKAKAIHIVSGTFCDFWRAETETEVAINFSQKIDRRRGKEHYYREIEEDVQCNIAISEHTIFCQLAKTIISLII